MAILVTGAAGFIGSHLLQLLLSETTEFLVGIDNFNDYYDPQLKRSNAAFYANEPRVRMVEGDFCHPETVLPLFREHRFRGVIHLGAYAGVRVSVEQPLLYQQVNVGGTLVLLEAARQYPVERFLIASSSTVYGTGVGIPFQEDAPLGIPTSPYGATKRAAELLGLTYFQLHQVPVVCLRPFSVYGPRLRPDLAMTLFARALWTERPIRLFGDGSVRRDFTHVSDICRGFLAALSAPCAVGETFNLGHSEPMEMRQLIASMAQALGKEPRIEYHPARPEDLPITYASLAKAEQCLDYHPRVAFESGIQEYCDWFRNWHGPAKA